MNDAERLIEPSPPIKSLKIDVFQFDKNSQQNYYDFTKFIAKKIVLQFSLPKLAIIDCPLDVGRKNCHNNECEKMLAITLTAKMMIFFIAHISRRACSSVHESKVWSKNTGI